MTTIDLRRDNLNPLRPEDEGTGRSFHSYSSYDVPESVSVAFDNDRHILSVEFQYIGGMESTRRHLLDENIKVYIGRNSRRLCRLEVNWEWATSEILKPLIAERQKTGDMTRLGEEAAQILVDRIEAKLRPFLDDLHKRYPHPNRVGNYSTTQKVIVNRARQLLPFQSVAT